MSETPRSMPAPATRFVVWVVASCHDDNHSRITELSNAGWEPFGVTGDSKLRFPLIWWRKQEVRNEQ